MFAFKCKMCGGYIELEDERRVYECKCCGSKQTVAMDIEELLKILNRANGHRMKQEFAEAEADYRTAISEYPQDAEGYWGLCLCKYGVLYETNGETAERFACCVRTSMDSVFDDINFRNALERSDEEAQEVLRAEAAVIDAIQVEAFKQSSINASCDVVICFLEKDEGGMKTSDSVLAHGIYNELADSGFKVVLLGSSTKERMGTAFNSYMDAAFNSAKVMVAAGTSNNNFYSEEMRDFWGRFMEVADNSENKTMMVCYKGMSGSELPNEFDSYKVFDAKSHGGMKELVGEIEHFITSYRKREKNKAYLSTADTMIEKGFDCIDDRLWDKADEILDKAINIYPKSSRAYFGKFLVQQKVREKDALKGKFKFALLENSYFEKAFSLATGKEKAAYEKMLRGNSSLIERAFMWLSEGDFTEATRLATQELIGNPESSQAYLCKFMASRNFKDWETLYNTDVKFIIQNDELFKKAYNYANDEERAKLDRLLEKNRNVVEKENSRLEYIEKKRKPYLEEYGTINDKLEKMKAELEELSAEANEKQEALKKLEPIKMVLLAIALILIAGVLCFAIIGSYMGKPMKTCITGFGVSAVVIVVFVIIYGCSGLRKKMVEKNAFKKFKKKSTKYKKESEKLEAKLDEVGDVILCATCGNTKKTTHGQCKVCESGAWYRVRYAFTDAEDCNRHIRTSLPKSYSFLNMELDEE